MRENLFLHDIQTLRARAHHRQFDVEPREGLGFNGIAIKLLNDLLATELVCAQRYLRYQLLDVGIAEASKAEEMKAHADDEHRHVALVAGRIGELGGEPDFSPDGLFSTSVTYCMSGKVLIDLVKEDIIAECIAMDAYRDAIHQLKVRDPVTTEMLIGILEEEELHAHEMAALMEQEQLRP